MLSIDHRFVDFAASAASFAVDKRKEEKKQLFLVLLYLGTSLRHSSIFILQ